MTLSFEKLGHNAMKCINDLKGEYEAPEVSDKRLEVEIWDSYRDACFKQSLQAEPFESCCIVPLNNLNPLHLSKGWVMLHYILNSDPIRGQKWLRAAHDSIDKAGTGDRTGINRNLWRDKTKDSSLARSSKAIRYFSMRGEDQRAGSLRAGHLILKAIHRKAPLQRVPSTGRCALPGIGAGGATHRGTCRWRGACARAPHPRLSGPRGAPLPPGPRRGGAAGTPAGDAPRGPTRSGFDEHQRTHNETDPGAIVLVVTRKCLGSDARKQRVDRELDDPNQAE
ncbi:MAG: hypothetical protein R3E96_02700 [Planctomycetota bacterium]